LARPPRLSGLPACQAREAAREASGSRWRAGDIKKLIAEAEIIDDLPFVKLEDVLKWKKLCNRGEKDKRDIELIENYLSQK